MLLQNYFTETLHMDTVKRFLFYFFQTRMDRRPCALEKKEFVRKWKIKYNFLSFEFNCYGRREREREEVKKLNVNFYKRAEHFPYKIHRNSCSLRSVYSFHFEHFNNKTQFIFKWMCLSSECVDTFKFAFIKNE